MNVAQCLGDETEWQEPSTRPCQECFQREEFWDHSAADGELICTAISPASHPSVPASLTQSPGIQGPPSHSDSQMPYQVLAQQLIVEDLHLILLRQLLAQTNGLLPHL